MHLLPLESVRILFIPFFFCMTPSKQLLITTTLGHTSCVGKHLAIAQIRLVAANLISRYRIEFAPGEGSGEAVERDMKDQLTARPGRFHLIFVPRRMDTLPVGNEESKGLVQ